MAWIRCGLLCSMISPKRNSITDKVRCTEDTAGERTVVLVSLVYVPMLIAHMCYETIDLYIRVSMN